MQALLERLSALNVRIELNGGELRISAPPGVLTAELQGEIRRCKDGLIERLRRLQTVEADAGLTRIVPDHERRHEPFPLNDVQHAYWIGRSGHFELSAVSSHVYYEIDCDPLNVARLTDAFNRVIARHDMLRAVIDADGRQRILPSVPKYSIAVTDVRSLELTQREATIVGIRERLSHRQIACDRWPLFAIEAAKLDERSDRLFLSWDFIFLDAWSVQLIHKQWSEFYWRPDEVLRPLQLSFRDYVLAQDALKESSSYLRSKQYWRERVGSLPAGPQLSVVNATDLALNRFSRRHHAVPADKWNSLKAQARKNGLTPANVLLAVFAEVLNRWSRSPHYCLNLTLFNRLPLHDEVDEILGDFTNLLVLEVDGREGASFLARARRIQDQFLTDLDHSQVSGVQVLRELAVQSDTHRRMILPIVFTSTLVLESMNGRQRSSSERLLGPTVYGISQTPQVWLDYQIFEVDGELICHWDAIDDIFPPGLLDDMFAVNADLLDRLATGDTAWNAEDVVRIDAHERLIESINATQAERTGECLQTAFIRNALLHPERPAVKSRDRELTYGSLLAHSNAIAETLVGLGVGPGQVVAVIMEKGWEQVVSVLGILIAGAAYLPIDLTAPQIRRDEILERAAVTVALTQFGQLAKLHLRAQVRVIEVTDFDKSIPVTRQPPPRQSETALAYVIFTSGSTGTPKGVMIDHRAALNTIEHMNALFKVDARDRVLALSELSFDLSVYDIFGTLAAGGVIVMPDARLVRDPAHWSELINDFSVTVWNSAPQLMNLMMDHLGAGSAGRLGDIRLVLLSGDWIPTSLPERIYRASPSAQVISLGGATEGSIWSIFYPIPYGSSFQDSIPYGKPLPNQHMYVLNSRLQLAPPLVVGDIYIGGIGVALGYCRDPERTARQFITHPATGEKLYRTGDLGRYFRDGNIEFLGREDSQVKIRGYRVELGEIAANLRQHPDVRDAAVHFDKNDERPALVAYIVRNEGSGTTHSARAVESSAYVEFLSARLPDYMVPRRYLELPALPLSANGKLDLNALRRLDAGPVQEERQVSAPSSATEVEILAIWRDVLKASALGVMDNFFDVGGDSLLITEVLRRLNRSRPDPLTITELFTYPTVHSLAKHLAQKGGAPGMDFHAVHAAAATNDGDSRDVAVIGFAGRFPDAPTIEHLWRNLVAEHCAIRRFTDEELLLSGVGAEELGCANYVKAGLMLEDVENFDAAYFGVSPREAELMDPQLRLLLECSVEALENSGHVSEQTSGRVGVFVGKGMPLYLAEHILPHADIVESLGLFTVLNSHEKDHAATLISYKLNLSGPGLSVNTACSTSLVAVHVACQSLFDRECEIAIAGGVSLMTTRRQSGYLYREGGITSPDGFCRAFADTANGTVFGSGVGLVVLKPLSAALRDRDTIHGVIKGSAINNDGSSKVGYTAPSTQGQAAVITAALARAGVPPHSINYIEAHGTGTNLGDPIEFAALCKVFRGAPRNSIAIGSIKTNIGHLDIAAGVTGLMKVLQSLKQRAIPASLHAATPNAKLNIGGSPFFINSKLRAWTANAAPRRAGVSSFGVGGTNCHVIVEEAPRLPERNRANDVQLFPLSAKSEGALARMSAALANHIQESPALELEDVAFTLQVGRHAHRFRGYVIAASADEASRDFSAARYAIVDQSAVRSARVYFVIPRAIEWNSDTAAYVASRERRSSAFSRAWSECSELVEQYCAINIRTLTASQVLNSGQSSAAPTARGEGLPMSVSHALSFSIAYATAKLWQSLGVQPTALIGEDIGEYAAATLAGIFTLEEALSLVVVRAKLAETLPATSTLRVSLPEAALGSTLLGPSSRIVAAGSSTGCVVVGPSGEISALSRRLAEDRIASQIEPSSAYINPAFYTSFLDTFDECVRQVQMKTPSIPMVSSITGEWLSPEQAVDATYWVGHLSATARMQDGEKRLREMGEGMFLELNAGHANAPTSGARSSVANANTQLFETPSVENGWSTVLDRVGRLWQQGLDIRWHLLHESSEPGRVPLPSYPFERQRYWIERPRKYAATDVVDAAVPAARTAERVPTAALRGEERGVDASTVSHRYERPDLPYSYVAPSSEVEMKLVEIMSECLGIANIGVRDSFFDLGGNSLAAARVFTRIQNEFAVELPIAKVFQLSTVKRLSLFILTSRDIAAIDSLSEEDLDELLAMERGDTALEVN